MECTSPDGDALRCTEQAGPEAFMALNETVLYAHEPENALVLGLMNRYRSGTEVAESARFLTIQQGQRPVGYAVQTRAKHGLIVSSLTDAAVDVLVAHLTAGIQPIARIVGPHTVTARFSASWTEQHDVQATLEMRQGVYRLRTVHMPDLANGRMQQATETVRERITAWEEAFVYDISVTEAELETNLQGLRQRTIEAERIYFWHDETGTPVCMAAKARESRNIGYISLVYTPPEHRGKGYASRLCALLSQNILDSGKSFCMLNTDLDNPTSNALYQRLGYEQIGEWAAYRFDDDGAE